MPPPLNFSSATLKEKHGEPAAVGEGVNLHPCMHGNLCPPTCKYRAVPENCCRQFLFRGLCSFHSCSRPHLFLSTENELFRFPRTTILDPNCDGKDRKAIYKANSSAVIARKQTEKRIRDDATERADAAARQGQAEKQATRYAAETEAMNKYSTISDKRSLSRLEKAIVARELGVTGQMLQWVDDAFE